MTNDNRKAFKAFHGAARKAFRQFKWMRDAGPFFGHYLRRGHMWDSQNGWVNLKAAHIATFYEISSELRTVRGSNYRRSEVATLRAMNKLHNLKARLP